MIKKAEAKSIAVSMMERASLYGHNTTWSILAQSIPSNMMVDRDKHYAFDAFQALEQGEAA